MKNNNYISAKIAFVSLFVICLAMQTFAQTTATQTIRGIVKSGDNNEPVPGTNIFLKGANTVGTLADGDGQFEFPSLLKPGDIIVFSFLGLKTTEYVVPEQAAGLVAIIMPPDFIQMVDEVLTEGVAPSPQTASTKSSRRINK